mgnify:CR=1 FL=1|tara:strand:+ start:2108 stop:2308 length:201 start_codon:yes stop_codon:yes gene_type:complete
MNWFWGFWFKDKFRTPFSVYKMSFAELIILAGMFFGVGYALTLGVQKLLDLRTSFKGTAVEAVEGE